MLPDSVGEPVGTERQRAESWDGLCLDIGQLDLPAAVMNRSGEFCGASPRGRRLLERFGAKVEGDGSPVPKDLLETLGRVPAGEAVVWNPGGVLEEASLGCARHRLGDNHFLLVMRELTQRNRELTKRLHQQRLEITGRLVASLVHDLRAPLASIVFSAGVLTGRMNELRPDESATIVSDIVESAQRLRHIVDGLLGFARLEPAEDAVSRVDDVFDRVSGLVRPAFREKGHTLRTYVAPDARRVRGSGLMIEQILVNLVLNAAEAASESIEVSVAASPDAYSRDRARICVQDTGPGIAADVRPHVFQPFFTTKQTGTGLGLTTAREAARELGGDLVLDPTAGRGASFSLYLDLAVNGGGDDVDPGR